MVLGPSSLGVMGVSTAGWLPTLDGGEWALLPWGGVIGGEALLSQQWIDWPSPPAQVVSEATQQQHEVL